MNYKIETSMMPFFVGVTKIIMSRVLLILYSFLLLVQTKQIIINYLDKTFCGNYPYEEQRSYIHDGQTLQYLAFVIKCCVLG